MSEEMLMHFSSNSNGSDPSLPTKLAKLEARMAGRGSGSSAPAWPASTAPTAVTAEAPSAPKPSAPSDELLAEPAFLSDSDDDVGDEYLIQANVHKRPRLQDEEQGPRARSEGIGDGRTKTAETLDKKTALDETNKKKQGRGRGRPASGTGRVSKSNEHSHAIVASTVQIPNGAPDLFSKEDIASLRGRVSCLEDELSKAQKEAAEYQKACQQIEKELKDFKEQEQQMKPKRTKILSDLLISVSKAERQETRLKVRQDSLRLGNVGVIRAGTIISETWEDGQALKDINIQLKHLLETKDAVDRHRKTLKKRQNDKNDGSDHENGVPEEDFLIQEEICKTRLSSLKREEETLLRERDRIELEKGRLIREMKRIRDEDGSRFNNFPILNQRYALLNLLGKGGFSEVYKAFDLLEHRYVACKLHGLNVQWSEEKKQSYIRHAIREYNIHKSLVHCNIVRLWDTFEIDHNTFCTVLEYCSGKDLDAVLKATPVLPEREARIIIVQIFQGLVYLNKRSQKIIHYDLKPGNVLFDEMGVAKVTDFGLSKIVEDDVGSQGMELTSQGAGTYWYLPPECFELSKTPLISSKVDVWSAGILLYQMLFGRRPFGHDQTQERILREDTIIKARRVDFPSRPAVSNEAKDLIRRCLTYDQAERPDVLTIAQDPFLSYTKK